MAVNASQASRYRNTTEVCIVIGNTDLGSGEVQDRRLQFLAKSAFLRVSLTIGSLTLAFDDTGGQTWKSMSY